jgi:hypothetical protein
MNSSIIANCKLINLPKIHTESGDITSINNNLDVPFEIKRIYYLYDVPNKADRGAHAHRELYQLVIAVSGSFEFELFDGQNKIKYTLNQPDQGLLIVPGIWRDLNNFSGGGICLVLASKEYDGNDYIRNSNEFVNLKAI